MKIVVFGARGAVGSRIVAEARARGHNVTAVVRSSTQLNGEAQTVKSVAADITDATALPSLLAGFDLAISAVRPPDGQEQDLATLTESLLTAAATAKICLLIVGGAASLLVPDKNLHTVLTAPGFLPDEVVPIARASFAQYELCREERHADWTYLSPPAMLVPGERKGHYRIGADTLLIDGDGNSHISMEDFSVAMLDEAERPSHRQARFTVAY
ncbi:NAD-dependent epimerase/dehydratase family protein [Hwanghaeella grinnelliae]|uniref:NAD-dependent epimerase/dehydratase family protein n=1 Tax=Hwanghaeella grinnelliae TaxID=2500179 RepID=A0A3S2VLX1_9PROT|nr:NAD(P)H-binding protein [Hwanghaeella grinnelliae]RVU35810.1 NAD-dependent epimerase/dehydratase family protein [Hwanghaeella grinnelliae]